MTSRGESEPRSLAGSGIVAALDSAPLGVIFLDAEGRPVRSNRRAGELLQAAPTLALTGDRLTAYHPVDDERLQRLIKDAIEGTETPAGLWLRGPEARSALHVEVSPMNTDGVPGRRDIDGVRAVTWLSRPLPVPVPTPQAIRDRYGLTPAEAELLAHLVAGRSVTETAHLRGVARETVRGQIKRAMKKLGVSRQADLVRLLLVGHHSPAPESE